ncbi:hypothetical protein HFN89_02680 [Rhizobium laguerreae]|nr:hypothetical protein [Rhizobium laguerreae]
MADPGVVFFAFEVLAASAEAFAFTGPLVLTSVVRVAGALTLEDFLLADAFFGACVFETICPSITVLTCGEWHIRRLKTIDGR